MKPVGFLLFIIGLMLLCYAKRIIIGRVKIDEKDRTEFLMLVSGAILSMRLVGLVILAVGFLFLLI
ncbi:MAG: hypothetical protein ATN31_00960 [Candidatus Epulonipiscioides saccharophilum]|nr:MAG: hypothetical protein ATN31_00960 [Epulopiscium sp. AS2M-Bin001]